MKNTRLLLVLALAIIFGLAAGYSALRYLSDQPTAIAPSGNEEVIPVVLAAKDLPLGTILAEEDLILVDWPAGVAPMGFANSKEELLERSLIAKVQTNEPILASKLAGDGQLGIIGLIPVGLRAMSVRVDEVVGVAGFITPQTRVDVILVQTPPGSSEQVAKVILQNIRALAAGPAIEETEDGTPVPVTVMTVLVTLQEAETLTLATKEGEIQMALRNKLDQEILETDGERASRLLSVGRVAPRRSVVLTGTTTQTAEESIMEIYRGGVLTRIIY
jgi:pilus assembly protein CpaB